MSAHTVITNSILAVSFVLDLGCGKKKEIYAAPIEQIKEIRNFEHITSLPNAKSYVKGIINLRGHVIPVIDVKEILGIGKIGKPGESKQLRILIADVNDSLYGLLVDEVDQVLKISALDIEPPPAEKFESLDYITGIAKTNQKLVVLLDMARLLKGSEDDLAEDISEQANQTVSVSITPPSHPHEPLTTDEIPSEQTSQTRIEEETAATSKGEELNDTGNDDAKNPENIGGWKNDEQCSTSDDSGTDQEQESQNMPDVLKEVFKEEEEENEKSSHKNNP